jgi:hypothetical protein
MGHAPWLTPLLEEHINENTDVVFAFHTAAILVAVSAGTEELQDVGVHVRQVLPMVAPVYQYPH